VDSGTAAALIGVGGTVLGTLLGAWLATAGSRRALRYQAMAEIAELWSSLWAPTPYDQLMQRLDRLDTTLMQVRARGNLRAALRIIAMECWQYSHFQSESGDPEPGIRSGYLDAYDSVRHPLRHKEGRRKAAGEAVRAVSAELIKPRGYYTTRQQLEWRIQRVRSRTGYNFVLPPDEEKPPIPAAPPTEPPS
jgi:hypothetical protein